MLFEYTENDREKVLSGYFSQREPLKLRLFPPKQKKQYIALTFIIWAFQKDRIYAEHEVNDILIDIYPDFVTLRRALVDYQFMERTIDCKQYWIKKTDNRV